MKYPMTLSEITAADTADGRIWIVERARANFLDLLTRTFDCSSLCRYVTMASPTDRKRVRNRSVILSMVMVIVLDSMNDEEEEMKTKGKEGWEEREDRDEGPTQKSLFYGG
jgi:hypothetical protein